MKRRRSKTPLTQRRPTLRLVILATMMLVAAAHAEPVQGRYVYYGNALSSSIGLAELEVWSGEKNLLANRPEIFTVHCILREPNAGLDACWRNLVDGKTNTLDKWPKTCEISAGGSGGYQDTALSYCAFEADLGETTPIDRIEIYRSRIRLENGQPWKLYQDLGWRYVLVLDEARKIVAWNVFNAYEPGWVDVKKGHWTLVPQPATGAPAGKVVPLDSRSWLSEAEFIRDFLGKPVVDLTRPQTDADRARLTRFEERNTPEAIEQLGREFFRIVDLDRPGLAEVKKLAGQERYAEALEAFKAPFFQTIGVLEQLYAGSEYSWTYHPDSRTETRSRDLLNGVYGDKVNLTIKRFAAGLLPPAKSISQMRPLLQSYVGTGDEVYLRSWEAMTDDWAIGFQGAADADPALRDYFVLISDQINQNLLDLLNASQSNPDFVKKLSGATLARLLMPIVEEMPVAIWRVCRTCIFNHTYNAIHGGYVSAQALLDFRAGQRLDREMRQGLMRLYTKGQYRDGPMVELGDEGHFPVAYSSPSLLYGKLCVAQPDWFTPAREAYLLDNLRQNELFTVRHLSPDGVGVRWMTGPAPVLPGLGDRDSTPGDTESSMIGYLQRLSTMLEPESRAVIDTVYGAGNGLPDNRRPAGHELRLAAAFHRQPSFLSDWLPYAGAWYFRGGWDHDSAILHMLKPTIANNDGGGFENSYFKAYERLNTTSFRFRDYATPLLTVFGTEIDRQRPCPKYGRYPSGSKQEVFTRAVEKPQPRRWFTDDTLDFGEAVYEGVYHNYYRYRERSAETGKIVVRYEDDPLTIPGVQTSRQIFQIRPARLFLQVERVHYANAGETHSNRFPVAMMLTEPGPETEKAFSSDQLTIDAGTKTIKSRNPGNPGATIAWFGQPEMTFTPYSINSSIINFWPQVDNETVVPEQDAKLFSDNWGKGFQTLNGPRRTSGRGVFASWPAKGESVVLAALYGSRPGEEPVSRSTDLSTATAAGLRIETTNRTVVQLLVARRAPAVLTLGPVTIAGEALLLVEQEKQPSRVMVLVATSLTLAGKQLELKSPDQTMSLNDQTPTEVEPICRPLDPPTIGPATNVFSDKLTVTLSSASPDTIIRYTTAVPTSRISDFRQVAALVRRGEISAVEGAERLSIPQEQGGEWREYTGPFTITKDTCVRARTFRKGIDNVPALPASGGDVSVVSYGFFTRQPVKPAQGWSLFRHLKTGLRYDYLEGRWFALWSYADVLPAKSSGTTQKLMDVSMRQTDEPFAVRYHGYLDVPTEGVYSFHAPPEYIDNTIAPGYDLRVFVDGEEWQLTETWHGRGAWSVPLAKGLHRFIVTFSDARARNLEKQRIDLAMDYPQPRTVWKGIAPELEISGPGIERQAIPASWFKHE